MIVRVVCGIGCWKWCVGMCWKNWVILVRLMCMYVIVIIIWCWLFYLIFLWIMIINGLLFGLRLRLIICVLCLFGVGKMVILLKCYSLYFCCN